MASSNFNLESLNPANPIDLPAGLRYWTKSTGLGEATGDGVTKSNANGNIAVILFDDFTPSGDVIEISLSLSVPYGDPNPLSGVGIFLAKDENGGAPTDNDGFALMFDNANYRLNTYNGPVGTVGTEFPVLPLTSNLYYKFFINLVTGIGYLFSNDSAVIRPITGLMDFTNFGIALNSGNWITTIGIQDSTNPMPGYIGIDNPKGFDLIKPNIGHCVNFVPFAGSLASFPLTITKLEDDTIGMKFIELDKTLGCSFFINESGGGYTNGVTNKVEIFFNTYFTGNIDNYSNVVCPFIINGIMPTALGAGNTYVGIPGNLHTLYATFGSPTGLPSATLVFTTDMNPANTSQPCMSFTYEGTITVHETGTGIVTRTIYILHGYGYTLGKYFATVNLTTGIVTNLVMEPIYFVNEFNRYPDQWVESFEALIPDASYLESGAEWKLEGYGQMRYNNGTEWTEWVSQPETGTILIDSTLNPTPVQMRGRSCVAANDVRHFNLVEVGGGLGTVYPWSVYNGFDQSTFLLNPTLDGEQNIINLANSDNGDWFSKTNVTVGVPSDYEGEVGANTKVTVSAVPFKGYSGEVEIFYKRINIIDFADTTTNMISITVPLESTWLDVIAAVNTKIGNVLTTDDYQDDPTWTGTADTEWLLSIKPTSLLYRGGVTLSITVEGAFIAMEDLVTDPMLDGLSFPV